MNNLRKAWLRDNRVLKGELADRRKRLERRLSAREIRDALTDQPWREGFSASAFEEPTFQQLLDEDFGDDDGEDVDHFDEGESSRLDFDERDFAFQVAITVR